MAENISLEELVLGYCRSADGLVEPPAYGAFEILLPDEVAARWGLTPHEHLAFTPEIENSRYIHFGHPLVETIVDELRGKIANGRFFINNVRPEKPKLYEVIEKTITFPNAKLFPSQGAAEQILLHHYVRLNFKVSLIADEKRELILPVWMDLQTGCAMAGKEIERAAIFDLETEFANIPPAPLIWTDEAPFSPQALTALLERARLSAAAELGDTLGILQKRLQRFLELDRVRLNSYYDDLYKDSERRLQKAEEDRRVALEAKLAAITAERQSKLADVEQKYHLHIQLQLVNLAIIAQPKLDLWVEIRKRGLTVKRRATWDPLLHTVEGLVCEVCYRPGDSLWLCENGHLAHTECLAPQCVECKRSYCQKCVGEVHTCVVCDRPICSHSLHRCGECGRVTCQDHLNACHADAGQPRRTIVEPAPVEESAAKVPASDVSKTPAPTAKAKPAPKKVTPRTNKIPEKSPQAVTGDYLEVYADPENNLISAIVFTKKRKLATREWQMGDQGISVDCWCEKDDCQARGIVYLPADAERLVAQINQFIASFGKEYAVPANKIRYFQYRQGRPFDELHLKVPASWKDPTTLERARAGYEALRIRNSRGGR